MWAVSHQTVFFCHYCQSYESIHDSCSCIWILPVLVAKAPVTFVTPVHPSAFISMAPTGQIFMKFDIGDFMAICWETWDLVTIGQKCREIHEDLNQYHLFDHGEIFQTYMKMILGDSPVVSEIINLVFVLKGLKMLMGTLQINCSMMWWGWSEGGSRRVLIE